MNEFNMYFNIGIKHIISATSFDHILFIICLTAVYLLNQWKQILVLITAFTVGHTVSLILATLNIISVNRQIIEVLIPITILITAFWNLFLKTDTITIKTHWVKYITALFFGLIHGLGFSSYLQAILGKEENIILPLFSFNLGIETGQIFVVLLILLVSIFLLKVFKVNRHDWILIFSGAGIGGSLILLIERLMV